MRLRHFSILSSWVLVIAGLITTALSIPGCSRSGNETATQTAAESVDYESVKHRISVSGVSSGAYMAVQTHVALADRVNGVASIAGGPYHCAQGSLSKALGRCIATDPIDVQPAIAYANDMAAAGKIAATEAMRTAKIWRFRSPTDSITSANVSVALERFYAAFVGEHAILSVTNIEAAHGWPTEDYGAPCRELGGDFINACGFDAAGALLAHFYGDLTPKNKKKTLVETIDLSSLVQSGSSIAAQGYLYVPPSCRVAQSECRLHIAFHGCAQSSEFVSDRFAGGIGLNEWAETNNIVVVYPQVSKSLGNPQGCWDWWGYTGKNYDLAGGKQIATVTAIIDAWISGTLH